MNYKKIKFLFLLIYYFSATNLIGQDKIESTEKIWSNDLTLSRGKKTRSLNHISEVTLYTQERKNDTIFKELEVELQNSFCRNDTIILTPSNTMEYFYRNNDYSNKSVSYYYKTSQKIYVPVKDITHIKINRGGLKGLTSIIMCAASISALIVAPAISIGNNFNEKRYYPTAGYSLLVFGAALTINLSFGRKIYPIHSANKKRKVWEIH